MAVLGPAQAHAPITLKSELATLVASLPFERAYATARLALAEAGLDFAIQRDELVRERDLGLVDGLTGVGIRKRYSDEAARHAKLGKFYYRPPRGESWVNVATCAGCSPRWSARSAFSRDKSRPSWPPHCVRSANRG